MSTFKRRSRIVRATAAVAVVLLSGASVPRSASAFVEVAPTAPCAMHPSHDSTSTALQYMSLEQVSDFYQNFPLQSAVLTCGVKASVADTIAQVKPQIEEISGKQTPITSSDSKHEVEILPQRMSSESTTITQKANRIDWEARRNLAYVLYGGVFVGLMSHIEYSYLFPFLFGDEKTLAITTEKVFFDNLIAAPIMWLPPAYFIKAWVYGSDKDEESSRQGILVEGLEKYLMDVKENNLLWQYWAIWFPAQSVSFSVVPDHLRVAFMASISFFWFILFSTVSSQGDAGAPSTE